MLDPGCYRRSSLRPPNLSPPIRCPPKWPASGRVCRYGLGFLHRNKRPILSPKPAFSPKLGAWPIYSTSFLAVISGIWCRCDYGRSAFPSGGCAYSIWDTEPILRPQAMLGVYQTGICGSDKSLFSAAAMRFLARAGDSAGGDAAELPYGVVGGLWDNHHRSRQRNPT